jgi:hypothetical protein
MTKRDKLEDSPSHRRLDIPTELDWGDYEADLDQNWAHDHYCGRSNEQVQKYFHNNPIEAASDLQFMPEIPFRYYMLGYRDFVVARDSDECTTSDAAGCFLNLVTQKLEQEPRHIVPIMPELLPALEYVATDQEEFEAEIEIYGNFPKQLARIRELYEGSKERYRSYP